MHYPGTEIFSQPTGRVVNKACMIREMFVRFCLFWLLVQISLLAQSGQAGLVRVTQVRSHRIRQSTELPGIVESRLVSTVAGEVAGLVEDFPVREGQVVRLGDVLAQLRRVNLELRLRASEAQLREDKARKKLAERTLTRARDLFERGVFSQQQLDEALFEFDAWRGRIERLRAVMEQLKDDIERTTILAPFHGVVVQESTQLGEWLEEGGPVVELLSLEHLEVAVELPERYFGAVRPQTTARVYFDALSGLELEGVVRTIIPRADPQAHTFPLKLSLEAKEGQIGVGMLARVVLPVGQSHVSRVVPKDAVVTQGQQQYVYLLTDDGSVRQTPVHTGIGVGRWVEVEGAIQSGQKVVIQGNERLRDGQTVSAEIQEYPFP